MREIKFRAKDFITGEWQYGLLGYANFGWGVVKSIQGKTDLGSVYNLKINERTISQYTGLKDKNGIEIYEKDIVKAKYKEYRDFGDEKADYFTEFIETIIWSNKLNGFALEINIEDTLLYRPLNFIQKVNNVELISIEVIGNIWDNPELLKVKQ